MRSSYHCHIILLHGLSNGHFLPLTMAIPTAVHSLTMFRSRESSEYSQRVSPVEFAFHVAFTGVKRDKTYLSLKSIKLNQKQSIGGGERL